MILNSPTISGSLTVTGNIIASGSITLSGSVASASFATSASNATNAISASYANNLTVAGTLTAQTLVVQTITSSVLYSSGSNVFGNNIANTQTFTGSVNITGSLAVVTNGTEFQVTSTGVNLGNALTDSHVISGSLRVNPNGLFVSGSGIVGIGTISPSASLHALGPIRSQDSRGGSLPAVEISGGNISLYPYISVDQSNPMSFITAGQYRMLITGATGNVLINTTNDRSFKLVVEGTDNNNLMGSYNTTSGASLRMQSNQTMNYIVSATNALQFEVGGAERMRIYSTGGLNILNSTGDAFCIQFNSGFKLRADSAGQMGIVNSGITAYADLRVNNMTKASGTFRINHPLESLNETHDLVHSFVEAPKADLIYRGKVTLVNGEAQANIDETATMTEGTFEVLCRDVQCFTTNESGWDLVKGKVIGNIVYIESQNPNSTDEISWIVIGERKDKEIKESTITDDEGNIIVEPLKEENSFKK